MLRNYGDIYLSQDVMTKELCFSAAMVTFAPLTVISSLNAPKANPICLADFTDSQISELEEYLCSYTEKPYVIEADGNIYVVIPSMYPSSTYCLLLRMDIEPRTFLRFVRERADFFIVSKNVQTEPARMSKRLDAKRAEFFKLCTDIERTFMHLERFNLSFNDEETIEGYCEQVKELSEFLGVPIDNFSVSYDGEILSNQNSFALFTAFCTLVMMLAKNEAAERKINMEISFSEGVVTVSTSFKLLTKIKITNETFLWEYLAANRKMLFECYNEGDIFFATFQPMFFDWSYLEIKQNRNDESFF